MCAQVSHKVNIEEAPRLPNLRARNLSSFCPLLQRDWVKAKKVSGLLQCQRLHGQRGI